MTRCRSECIDDERALKAAVLETLIPIIESSKSLITVEELSLLQGYSRADLAVLGDSWWGFEMKSDRDGFARIGRQKEAYAAVFDRAVLVVTERRLDRAKDLLPEWWGIVVAQSDAQGRVALSWARRPGQNPAPDPRWVAEFLRKAEVLELLRQKGADSGTRRLPVWRLWDRAAEACAIEEIREAVYRAFLAREDWHRKGLLSVVKAGRP